MLLGLVLSATGIVLFTWAVLRLAVLALPVGLGVAVFLWSAGSQPGPLLGLLLGFIVSVAVFLVGRLALGSRLPTQLRATVALLFAVPAGIAGYSIVSGLMYIGGAGAVATGIVAATGAVIITGAAVASLSPSRADHLGDHRSPLQG